MGINPIMTILNFHSNPCAGKIALPFGLLVALICLPLVLRANEETLLSPDGSIAVTVSDTGGLTYRVGVDKTPILVRSKLGLDFEGGFSLGRTATITAAKRETCDSTWENRLGKSRQVRNHYNELKLELSEAGTVARRFGLIVRAYDDGVAFRYELPKQESLAEFVLTRERNEFAFAADYRCWVGNESICAENQYPEKKLSEIPAKYKPQAARAHTFESVLPLLVETPVAFVAVAESDLLDWAGMSLTGTGKPLVTTTLAPRADGRGLVVSATPRVSPWRVLMIGRRVGDLVVSDLVDNLATPSRLADASWVRPGACAWDPWWTGINLYGSATNRTGMSARGNTAADRDYIDLAHDMGWPYQLMDWSWYKNQSPATKGLNAPAGGAALDFASVAPDVDIPGLISYAKSRDVNLLIWAHSRDVRSYGVKKALALFAKDGFAGVKIDFINSQSQEAVRWCEQVLDVAAQCHLLIDFHGTYKPTGLARTYPNFITQEGVMGNEYNKMGGVRCTPLHTITLPFTRGLLGPMDFTPGGFVNRTKADFKERSVPAQVIGTRARQLAMTVIYTSPLTVLCDSPANYRGQPGLEFLRSLPTVWDETVVPSAEVAKHIVIARRSGNRWYVAAMNGDAPLSLNLSLSFLGKGRWQIRSFADIKESAVVPEKIDERTAVVSGADSLALSLAPAGGYAAIMEPEAGPGSGPNNQADPKQ